MYSYRLKTGHRLEPNTEYRVIKDGTECAYLWDDKPVYDRGLLLEIDKQKIGWIPASENFDWGVLI